MNTYKYKNVADKRLAQCQQVMKGRREARDSPHKKPRLCLIDYRIDVADDQGTAAQPQQTEAASQNSPTNNHKLAPAPAPDLDLDAVKDLDPSAMPELPPPVPLLPKQHRITIEPVRYGTRLVVLYR